MMKKPTDITHTLYQLAEEKARLDEDAALHTLTLDDAKRLFHELRVYQVELEMQNEELRRTQHELEISRSRYFDLYDLAPAGFLTLSEQGIIQEANLAAAIMLGDVRKNLLNKPISRFIFSEDQELYNLRHKKLLESNEVQSWEMRLVRENGSCFWARLQSTPPRGGEYWVTFVDISQRKQAEEELREKNELLSLFIKHSPIYAYVMEVTPTESRVLLASDNFIQLIGIPASEMVGKATSEFFPPEFSDEINADDRAVVSAGGVLEREECFNGCSYTTIKFPIVQGDETLVAGYTIDITERKQTEDALRESENRFRSIMDMAPNIAVQGYNLEGITTYWNHASESVYGYTSEEAIGRSLLELIIPPEMREDVRKAMTWMAETGESIPAGELLLMRKDGSRVPVFSSHALLKPLGKDMELFCLDLDLTLLRQAERELRQAKEAAETANRAKSDFLATMSHEIRTPLGAILGNVELLEESPLSPQQQESLRDCKSASQMLLQVINDVLDFSKIEAGKLVLADETFSVPSTSRQLVRMLSATASQKGLSLFVLLADDLPEYICADQQRFSQIISNLLSNAIKFTSHGTVGLEISRQQSISAAHSDNDKVVLKIVVRDTGIGIPPDKLEHVFESFTQVESFNTRKASGTGLGLPICRRLLDLMGGSITVSSVPGEGSIFTVILPVMPVMAPVPAQVPAPAQAQARKILLADDDERGRSAARKLLQRKGYDVTAVEDGAGILDALQREDFDIILTDISMPDMEGTQVARIIRSGELKRVDRHIPIIAMTAHAFSDDRESFMAAGINGYVAKPVNLEELFRQIEALCAGGG